MQKKLSEFENPSDFEIKKIFGYYESGGVLSVQFQNNWYAQIHSNPILYDPCVCIFQHYESAVCGPIIPDNIPPEVIDAAKKLLSNPDTEIGVPHSIAERYGIK